MAGSEGKEHQSRQVVRGGAATNNKRPLQGGVREEGHDGEVPACEVETLR